MKASQDDMLRFLSQSRHMIDERNALPLYHQVKQVLIDYICDGILPADSDFFSEEEIAESLAVSRPTAGRAMKELISDGYIRRERGKRAIVQACPSLPLVFMAELLSFGQMLTRVGKAYRTSLISREVLRVRGDMRKTLGTDEDEVVYLRRLRFVDEKPILFVNSYLPKSRFGGLMDLDSSAFSTDLYLLLEERFGVSVRYAKREVMAVRSGIDETKMLGIPLWDPCLRLSGSSYDDKDQPVEWFRSYLKASRGVLKSHVRRDVDSSRWEKENGE